MKVTKETSEGFRPITLHITLETKTEAQEFYCIFNHRAVISSVDLDCEGIRMMVGDVEYKELWEFFLDEMRLNS